MPAIPQGWDWEDDREDPYEDWDDTEDETSYCSCSCGCWWKVDFDGDRCPMCREACP